MRYLTLGVAACLALFMVAPASAFTFDSTGGSGTTNPDGTAAYADPDDLLEPKVAGSDSATDSHSTTSGQFLKGLQFNMSTSGRTSSSASGEAMGWTNPQPGRLTH